MTKSNLCNLCRAPLLWAKTVAGNPVPLDNKPTKDGNIALINGTAHTILPDDEILYYDGPRYTNHHATCTLDISKRRTKE